MAEGNVKGYLRRVRGTGGENGTGGNDSQIGPLVVTPSEVAGEGFTFELSDGTDNLPIGPIENATGTATASGDTVILSVPTGQKVLLYHVSFVPRPTSTNDVVVVIKVGSTAKYTWECNKAGSGFSRSPKSGQGWIEGADGEDVVINLSVAESVSWNLEYDLVTV